MNENDALDQRLEAAVMDLHNRLNVNTFNGQTDFNPPKSYKPDMPVVKRMDVKSLFSGEGMPPLEDPQPNPPRLGAYFDTSLDFISGWTDPATTLPQNPGNVPPTPPPPPAGCPTDGTVTLVLSGVVSCGCFDSSILTLSIDGTYTLTWNPTDEAFELDSQGTLSSQAYSDVGCGTPSGAPVTGTWDISVTCGDNFWGVTISDHASHSITAFLSAVLVVAGAPATNFFQCGGSTNGNAGGGTATITV